MGSGGYLVPLLHEEVKILMHIGFKLSNALCRECVRDRLALSSMFCSISGVEEAASDRDKCIIVVPVQYKLELSVQEL